MATRNANVLGCEGYGSTTGCLTASWFQGSVFPTAPQGVGTFTDYDMLPGHVDIAHWNLHLALG